MSTKKTSDYISEADVETKYIYNILLKEILRFPSKQVYLHVPVKITHGRATTTKEADVVIKNKSNKNIIVIDSKAPTEKLDKYFAQIDSYAFALETPISILCNYHRMIIRVYLSGNRKQIIYDKNINETESDNYFEFKKLVEEYISFPTLSLEKDVINLSGIEQDNTKVVTNYRRLFRQIHTKIRSIDKLDPSASFDEFSKVLFVKIINDIVSDDEKLTISKIEVWNTKKEKSDYIDKWFKDNVKEYYPGIFAQNEKIALSPTALCQVLEILDKQFDLKDTLNDIKGRAFEEFLPSQLRGKGLGQFFTPRSIVDFMIELADISITDKVLDFASGSGGFLIKAFDKKRQLINETQQQYFDLLGKTRESVLEEAKCQIFGIDAEPRAVRTAKMNMLLWGDGKQIQYGNGLTTSDFEGHPYLATEYKEGDDSTGVDIILANPPFGSTEEDQNILKNYSLSKQKKEVDKNTGETTITYSKEKTEHLFVEKAYKMLKPNGKLLIVLPEGIFSNKKSETRDFILSLFIVDTIVKLPKHTFVMSGVDTINTVILIARKNTKDREKSIVYSDKRTWQSNKYMKINFASVNQIGYEPSGKSILGGYANSDLKFLSNKLISNDYTEILANPLEYAELQFSDDDKSENWKKSMIKFLRIEFDKVPHRLDPTYYFFHEETKDILCSFKKLNIKPENITKEKPSEKELNDDVEKIYKYISVIKTLDGNVSHIEEYTVDDLLSLSPQKRPQKISKGNIVFNPYRINTGSIIYIDEDGDNLITSPAYVVIKDLDINPRYFVQLLKTPFMKYQIQVLASGSVRDNFSADKLKELRIPNLTNLEQDTKIRCVDDCINKIQNFNQAINDSISSMVKILNDFA